MSTIAWIVVLFIFVFPVISSKDVPTLERSFVTYKIAYYKYHTLKLNHLIQMRKGEV